MSVNETPDRPWRGDLDGLIAEEVSAVRAEYAEEEAEAAEREAARAGDARGADHALPPDVVRHEWAGGVGRFPPATGLTLS